MHAFDDSSRALENDVFSTSLPRQPSDKLSYEELSGSLMIFPSQLALLIQVVRSDRFFENGKYGVLRFVLG